MSRRVNKTSAADADARQEPSAARQGADALAHELANLLDGSLRHLGMALTSLRQPATTEESDELVKRLEAASGAMHQMATLIHRWMSSPQSARHLFEQAQTIGQMIDHAVRLLSPAANLRRIGIHVQMDKAAAVLSAGPLYPVIANALRNSIEAMEQAPMDDRPRVIKVAAMVRRQQLHITVTDTGPGLSDALTDAHGCFAFGITTKQGGHGVGLRLSRDIARSLGGELELTNRPPHGAVLTLRCPVDALNRTDK